MVTIDDKTLESLEFPEGSRRNCIILCYGTWDEGLF